MDNLMKLVTTALEWTYAAGEMDTQTLETAVELLTFRRDTIQVLDAPVAKESHTASKEETQDGRKFTHL